MLNKDLVSIKTMEQLLERILPLSQEALASVLTKSIRSVWDDDKYVYHKPGEYIICEGDIPVILVAHLDTVHTAPPSEIFYDKDKGVMWAPNGIGGDDRCGVVSVLSLISAGYRPTVIFTYNEEIGCVGASQLVNDYYDNPFIQSLLDNHNFMIQLDRKGFSESVYYSLESPEFEAFINDYGFDTHLGSYTDIAVLAPILEIAAVNLSAGYMDEHTDVERIYIKEMLETATKVSNILDDEMALSPEESKAFPYLESEFNMSNYGYNFGYGSYGYGDDTEAWDNYGAFHNDYPNPYYRGDDDRGEDSYFIRDEKGTLQNCEYCGINLNQNNYTPNLGSIPDSFGPLCDDCYHVLYPDEYYPEPDEEESLDEE